MNKALSGIIFLLRKWHKRNRYRNNKVTQHQACTGVCSLKLYIFTQEVSTATELMAMKTGQNTDVTSCDLCLLPWNTF